MLILVGKDMTKKIVKQHRFFFVKPGEKADADEFADKVANIECVEEVLLTEGDFGFVVKARLGPLDKQKELAKCISEASSEKCGLAVSHYQYRK